MVEKKIKRSKEERESLQRRSTLQSLLKSRVLVDIRNFFLFLEFFVKNYFSLFYFHQISSVTPSKKGLKFFFPRQIKSSKSLIVLVPHFGSLSKTSRAKMQQTLFVIALLFAVASAALPRDPRIGNNTGVTRDLNNPLGPDTRRVYFGTSVDCNKVMDNWGVEPLDGGSSYCWFTSYCNIDPNTGYTGYPYLHVSHPDGMVRCKINSRALPGVSVTFVQFQSTGFAATNALATVPSDCQSVSVNNKPAGYPGNWQPYVCENNHHCHECMNDRIDNLEFHFE